MVLKPTNSFNKAALTYNVMWQCWCKDRIPILQTPKLINVFDKSYCAGSGYIYRFGEPNQNLICFGECLFHKRYSLGE